MIGFLDYKKGLKTSFRWSRKRAQIEEREVGGPFALLVPRGSNLRSRCAPGKVSITNWILGTGFLPSCDYELCITYDQLCGGRHAKWLLEDIYK